MREGIIAQITVNGHLNAAGMVDRNKVQKDLKQQ